MAIYYVDKGKNASCSNDGLSRLTPFPTVECGILSLLPGDTLIIEEGRYNEIISVKEIGTAKNPVRIHGAGNVVIDSLHDVGEHVHLANIKVLVQTKTKKKLKDMDDMWEEQVGKLQIKLSNLVPGSILYTSTLNTITQVLHAWKLWEETEKRIVKSKIRKSMDDYTMDENEGTSIPKRGPLAYWDFTDGKHPVLMVIMPEYMVDIWKDIRVETY